MTGLYVSIIVASIVSVLSQHTYIYSSKCLKLLQTDIQLTQFHRARNELKHIELQWKDLSRSHFVGGFQRISTRPPHSCVFNISNVPVWYITVYKGGNNNIRSNLRKNMESPPRWTAFCPYPDNSSVSTAVETMGFVYQTAKSFTFVREPLSHFLSGAREAYYRKFHSAHSGRGGIPVNLLANEHTVKRVIYDILNGTIMSSFSSGAMHMFPMAAILYRWRPNFIGRLETMEHDWVRVNELYHLNMSFDSHASVHQSSTDDYNLAKMFSVVFESSDGPSYIRALCHIFLVDYECFNFSLPDVCLDISFLPV